MTEHATSPNASINDARAQINQAPDKDGTIKAFDTITNRLKGYDPYRRPLNYFVVAAFAATVVYLFLTTEYTGWLSTLEYLVPRITAAASVAFLILFAVYFYTQQNYSLLRNQASQKLLTQALCLEHYRIALDSWLGNPTQFSCFNIPAIRSEVTLLTSGTIPDAPSTPFATYRHHLVVNISYTDPDAPKRKRQITTPETFPRCGIILSLPDNAHAGYLVCTTTDFEFSGHPFATDSRLHDRVFNTYTDNEETAVNYLNPTAIMLLQKLAAGLDDLTLEIRDDKIINISWSGDQPLSSPVAALPSTGSNLDTSIPRHLATIHQLVNAL